MLRVLLVVKWVTTDCPKEAMGLWAAVLKKLEEVGAQRTDCENLFFFNNKKNPKSLKIDNI